MNSLGFAVISEAGVQPLLRLLAEFLRTAELRNGFPSSSKTFHVLTLSRLTKFVPQSVVHKAISINRDAVVEFGNNQACQFGSAKPSNTKLPLLSFVIIEMFQAISTGLRLLSNHLTPMVELRCQSYGDHRKFYDRTPSKFVVSTSIESSRFFFPESESRLRSRLRPKPFNSNVNFEVLINFHTTFKRRCY